MEGKPLFCLDSIQLAMEVAVRHGKVHNPLLLCLEHAKYMVT